MNPFAVALDEHGEHLGQLQKSSGGGMLDAFRQRFQNLTINVKCTLEEFFYGCQKEVSFERIILEKDGKHQRMEVATKIINIKPGMGAGSILNFPREGHQRAGQVQSDLIINLQ
jgi:hypothetical protein